jgi:RNA polymerase sigma factor (sigma-70 family)
MARHRFWIHDKDKKGRPLDRKIVKAAEEIAPTLTRYRHREIDSESTSDEMLQSAVEAASDATRRNRVENPPGYLTSIYKHVVDKFLDHQNRVVPVDDEFLEDLANSRNTDSFEDSIHTHLVLEKLMHSMDPEMRKVCELRLHGYSVNQIAKTLKITPNSLSVRYTRAVKKAVREVLEGKRGAAK